jgi:hypothetical protein
MKPRSTIFDSVSERELFDSIAGAWEPKFKLYPHIPFANLIDLDPHLLSAEELSFLHKTTVDYALTTAAGEPLLAIEFDGLGHGLSREGQYIQVVGTSKDKNRAWKLNLKVRVANTAGFPLLVISYEEKAILDESLGLTIAHAIIGEFLARRATMPRMQELLSENWEWLEGLPEDERHEEIQDMLVAAEIDADMEYNPVARRGAELTGLINKLDIYSGARIQYEEDPPRPANAFPFMPGFDERAFSDWWANVKRFGCTYTVITMRHRVSRTVWFRNLSCVGISPFGLLEDVAKLVASVAAIEEMRTNGSSGAAV